MPFESRCAEVRHLLMNGTRSIYQKGVLCMGLHSNNSRLVLPTSKQVNAEFQRRQHNRISGFYPDTGPFSRERYPKHLAFFKAGGEYRERAAIAANRVGKTEGIGAYETTCHLTGKYPDWWCGHRFDHPIQAWVAGDTNTTTRDILQAKLLGKMTRED